MRAKVISLLKMKPETYETLVISIYFHWCDKHMKNQKSLQKALVCKPLFNWWQREFEKLEQQFIDDAEIYKSIITKKQALKLYNLTTKKIHNRFSKPLIQYAHDS